MNLKEPNYKNSITGIPNSIMKYFGCIPINDTLPCLDKMLDKDYTNIVLLLFDGMGTDVLAKNLPEDSYLNINVQKTISSTFPPTTVAATTSIDSGLYPSQHGWLGWTVYYPQIDKNVTVFLNTDDDGNLVADYNVPSKFYPYTSIRDKIKEKGYRAYAVSPFGDVHIENMDDLCKNVQNLCATKDKKYIYAYYPHPDGIMHKYGCTSKEAKEVLIEINKKVEELCSNVSDSLIIITADHGHLDSKGVCILDYQKIIECLKRLPSIEPRALNLFIKENKKKQFIQEFNKEFGDKFILLSKEEVLNKQLFGIGSSSKMLDELAGDYIAIAISDLSIYNSQEEKDKFIGVHAGLTESEMEVPFIAIST
jgi:hypothetical protein